LIALKLNSNTNKIYEIMLYGTSFDIKERCSSSSLG
jgi:hypothetical protein